MTQIITYPCGGASLSDGITKDVAKLIGSPFSLHDGEPIVVSVEMFGESILRVSDRALASDALALEGVDLATASMKRSWQAIQSSVDERFCGLGPADDWEILAYAPAEDLSAAINEVVAAVLRADGLSSLQRPKSTVKRLDHAVIRAAKSAGLETLPNAPVRMKSGAKRNVTARVSSLSDESHVALIQTFGSSKSGWEISDRASGLFGNLAESGSAAKVSVLGSSVHLTSYQLDALKDVSDVVRESDLSDWMIGLAA